MPDRPVQSWRTVHPADMHDLVQKWNDQGWWVQAVVPLPGQQMLGVLVGPMPDATAPAHSADAPHVTESARTVSSEDPR